MLAINLLVMSPSFVSAQPIIEVGDSDYYLPQFNFADLKKEKEEVKNLSDSLAFLLAKEHAVYVQKRYQLLKDLHEADSSTFTKYAVLVFWEINSIFPDNVFYREKIEILENEDPNISRYFQAERKAWQDYKKMENKYR